MTPTKSGYQFSPTSQQVTVNGADVTVSVIVGSPSGGGTTSYDIQGRVVDTAGNGIEFIRVFLQDVNNSDNWSITTTNEKGEFAFDDKASGTYQVKPLSDELTFSPESSTITYTGTATTLGTFVGTEKPSETTFAVSGSVVDAAGAGIASAELRIYRQGDSDLINAVYSDTQGNYQFTGLTDGVYQVYVYKENVPFTKDSQTVTVSGADATVAQFTASGGGTATYSVSGTITDYQGKGVPNVSVYLVPFTEAGQGGSTTARTDDNGLYYFSEVSSGVYKIRPIPSGYDSYPASVMIKFDGTENKVVNFTLYDKDSVPVTTVSGIITVSGQQKIYGGEEIYLLFEGVRIYVGYTKGDEGQWEVQGPVAAGTYTVKPMLRNHVTTPETRVITVETSIVPNVNFTAVSTIPTYTLSGRIIDSFGDPIAGVMISVSDWVSTIATLTTDANGFYTLSGLSDKEYVLTPSKDDYKFGVISRSVKFGGSDKVLDDWVGMSSQIYYSSTDIIGYVKDKTGKGISGATVTLTDVLGNQKTNITVSEGSYYFKYLTIGKYIITVSKDDLTFTPSVQTIRTETILTNVVPDFVADIEGPANTYSISGKTFAHDTGAGIPGVTVELRDNLSDKLLASVVTDANGEYSFGSLADGSYAVSVSHPVIFFDPITRLVTIDGAHTTDRNFEGWLEETTKYNIYGLVVDANNVGINTSDVRLTGEGVEMITTPDSNGSYSFTNIPNGTYTISVSLTGYTFEPQSQKIDVAGADVTADKIVGTRQGGPGNAGSHIYAPYKTGSVWVYKYVYNWYSNPVETETGDLEQRISGTTILANGREYWVFVDEIDETIGWRRVENDIIYMNVADWYTYTVAHIARRAEKSAAAKIARSLRRLSNTAPDDIPVYKLGASAGSSWDIFTYTEQDNLGSSTYTMTGSSLGTETVNIGLGGFQNCKKFKIVLFETYKSADATYTYRTEEIVWFAPNVGVVKDQYAYYEENVLTDDETDELTSYTIP